MAKFIPTKEELDYYDKSCNHDPLLKEYVEEWTDLPFAPQLTDPDFYMPLISREAWGALPAKSEMEPLKIPVMYIRYTYVGDDDCNSVEECSNFIRELQKTSMEKGLPDLPYNFLIGGKGIVYEGRGWNFEADREEKYNEFEGLHGKLKGQTVDVAYIGDLSIFGFTDDVQMGAYNFLKDNVVRKNIHEMFQVIPIREEIKDYTNQDSYFTVADIENYRAKKAKREMEKSGKHHHGHHISQ